MLRHRTSAVVASLVSVGLPTQGCLEFNPDFIEPQGGGTGGTNGVGTGGSGSADTGNVSAEPCAATPTFEDGKSPTGEVFVAPTGTDDASCGAQEAPCATLGFASTLVGPGGAIRLLPGVHAGGALVDGLVGTSSAPIWIGAAPGQTTPIVEGGESGILLRRAQYVIVHDIEIRNALFNGINVDDGAEFANPEAAHDIILRDLDIHDIGQGGNNDCVKLSGVNDFFLLDSQIAGCGGSLVGSGLDCVGCRRGLLARNVFRDMPQAGSGVSTKGGSQDIELRWNRFVDAGSRALNLGGSTGPTLFRPPLDGTGVNAEARNIRAIANFVQGSDTPVAFVGCIDCLAAHNTIVDPARWVLRILQESTSDAMYTFEPASGGRFVNNLIYFRYSALSAILNIGVETAPETFSFDNNLWYAYDEPAQSDPATELPTAEVGGVYGEDPVFAASDGDAYQIPADSPAAAAGTLVADVVGDIRGRCYPDPPTIGAWAELP